MPTTTAKTKPLSDAELLALASKFEIISIKPRRRYDAPSPVSVERRSSDPEAWAIVSHNFVLTRRGDWEYEPVPSSRNKAFLKRARFSTARAAIAFALDYLQL